MTSIHEPADVEAFAARAQPPAVLLGLDLGTKTIGVAACDPGQRVAGGVETIRRTKFGRDAARLAELANVRDARGVVLGLPLNMDGSEGPRAQSTRAFARNLAGVIDLPILFWDERWTTVTAERQMIEADWSRAKRAGNVDRLAAAVILQACMDRLANLRATEAI